MSLTSRVLIAAILLTTGASCSQVSLLSPATPTPAPSGYVDVDGRNIYYSCYGEGTPTVLIEEALNYSGTQESSHWGDAIKAVSARTRICFYDRAGIGFSDKASTPSTIQDTVDDLHAMLNNSHLSLPIVLVGLWEGALPSIQFSSQYPQEVAGLILFHPVHPGMPESILGALPSPSPDEPRIITMTRDEWSALESADEAWASASSRAQVAEITSLGEIHLLVVSPLAYDSAAAALAPDTWPAVEEVYRELQASLLGLSTRGSHEVPVDNTNTEQNAALSDAILYMLDEVGRAQ